MSWLPIILLAVAAFAVAAFALRIPRRGWTLLGAVLLFGLAGYALQGSPGQGAAPKAAQQDTNQGGEAVVEARRALYDPAQPLPGYLTLSDGFARRGRFADAAQMLRQGLADNPGHGEGWLALANALVEHAEGQVTPASLYAYARAEETSPGNPGPAYFLGVALLRSGQPGQASQVWKALLEETPEDAPWREELQVRIERLDAMMAQMPVQDGS